MSQSGQPDEHDWQAENRRGLIAEIKALGAMIKANGEDSLESVVRPTTAASRSSALDRLCYAFELSEFERHVVLMGAASELDGGFSRLCAKIQGDPAVTYPTLSLALATLNDPDWSVLAPNEPLRYWDLIRLGPDTMMTRSPLRLDEPVLHYLIDGNLWDPLLASSLQQVPVVALPDSQTGQANHLAGLFAEAQPGERPVIAQLIGRDTSERRGVAAVAIASLGLKPFRVAAERLPLGERDLDIWMRHWERMARLLGAGLIIETDALESDGRDTSEHFAALAEFVDRHEAPLLLSARGRELSLPFERVVFEVSRPGYHEQERLWRSHFAQSGKPGDDGASGTAADSVDSETGGLIHRLCSQFDFSSSLIATAMRAARADALADARPDGDDDPRPHLWDACRRQSRGRLENLAHRIPPSAAWKDLVLPPRQAEQLRELISRVKHRGLVYRDWGMGDAGGRGLGVTAMFAGVSGTGKTLAAEVVSGELGLDLYRVDLASLVSKYIGETEKNLRQIFDAAEDGGAVLLFDEADAIFGKRTEVKQSHDRYANLEVGYLLQRMEQFRGLAILTTNLKDTLDSAFQRRLQAIVEFPYPDMAQRARIWAIAFPESTPRVNLDLAALSELDLSGGQIRNVALSAAFMAAEEVEPIQMSHIIDAARREYAKRGAVLGPVGWAEPEPDVKQGEA